MAWPSFIDLAKRMRSRRATKYPTSCEGGDGDDGTVGAAHTERSSLCVMAVPRGCDKRGVCSLRGPDACSLYGLTLNQVTEDALSTPRRRNSSPSAHASFCKESCADSAEYNVRVRQPPRESGEVCKISYGEKANTVYSNVRYVLLVVHAAR
eukprot:6186542-Pleurochrysis_carterae.AAC.2